MTLIAESNGYLTYCGASIRQEVKAICVLVACALVLAGCGLDAESQASDPVVADYAVAYIERPLVLNPETGRPVAQDRREPDSFRPGARLMLKGSAAPSAAARDITSRVFSDPVFLDDDGLLRYDVRDLTVSYDGTRLLFSMHAPDTGDDDLPEPTWNIWEYDLNTDQLRRVIESDIEADAAHDLSPTYLVDGSIVFSSTRQRTSVAILLDEGKPQFAAQDEARRSPAFLLHVMNEFGEDIRQITFNQSHDLDPTVMSDGSILFSRWDAAGQTPANGFNLYRINPDGTGLGLVFGRHSHTVEGNNLHYFRPVEVADNQVLVQARGLGANALSALPARIDISRFAEHASSLDGSPGQGVVSLIPGQRLDGQPGLSGVYDAVAPMYDGSGRYLVSWSPCRLQRVSGDGGPEAGGIVPCTAERLASEDYEAAPPLYGLWLWNGNSGTQLPIAPAVEGRQISEAVLMTSRPRPQYRSPDLNPGDLLALAQEGFGVIHIRSVYDLDGEDNAPGGIATTANPLETDADSRPARFVRIEKPVSLPDRDVRMFDNAAFGISQAQRMREILGYAPVEPDGSVRVAVPANVAFAISVVDRDGRRTSPRHQNWLQLRPGEEVTCNGCHTPASTVPHGHYAVTPLPANTGAATTGVPFPGTRSELFADMGETMAQTWSRFSGIRRLSPDLQFEDVWTDPELATPAEPFSLSYADLATPMPVNEACAESWSAACRAVIHYEDHIHPIWSRPRMLDGADSEPMDYTCTGCHAITDSEGAARRPDADLHLGDGLSADNPRQLRAYRELLATRFEQELVDGVLRDRQVESGEVVRDENGDPVLDDDGNEIPIFVRVPVAPVMSVNGARASVRFMDTFADDGIHGGFLDDAELRLISEWLDLGAQYFNNPFEAPEN